MDEPLVSEAAIQAIKAAPPLTIGGLAFFGVSLQEWVYIVTIVYVLLQMYFLLVDRLFSQKGKDGRKR